MANPLDSHWKVVKRILRYLKGTIHHGLLLQLAQLGVVFSLRAYCDSDWAQIQTIDARLLAHASSLTQIWCPSLIRSNNWFPVLALKQNIGAWKILLVSSLGFSHCLVSSSFLHSHLHSFVIILVQSCFPTILFFIPAPSI